ncbi:MAG: DUF1902 domain-containing protein [Pseudomonadota bacterium]
MTVSTIIVEARWDGKADVWTATSTSISGLAVEAPTLEALKSRVEGAIADLIELNGIDSPLAEIPVCIMASQLGSVTNPKAA